MTQIGGRHGRGRAAIGLKSPVRLSRMPKAMLVPASVLSACLVLSGCGGAETTEPAVDNSGNHASAYGEEQPEELDTAVRHSPAAIQNDDDVGAAPAQQNSVSGPGSPADPRSTVTNDSPDGPGPATVSRPPASPDSTMTADVPAKSGPVSAPGSATGSGPASAIDSGTGSGSTSLPGSDPATAPNSWTGTGSGSFATLEDACEAINAHMLSIAFAPLTYSYGGGRAEAKQAVSELPQLRQKAPPGLQDDFARMEAIFAASGGDYSKVDSNAFQRAMAPVESWISGNCPGL